VSNKKKHRTDTTALKRPNLPRPSEKDWVIRGQAKSRQKAQSSREKDMELLKESTGGRKIRLKRGKLIRRGKWRRNVFLFFN